MVRHHLPTLTFEGVPGDNANTNTNIAGTDANPAVADVGPMPCILPSSHAHGAAGVRVMCVVCCCRERVPALLSKLRLQHGAVEVHGTPRRLAVLVHDLAAAQTPQESKVSFTHVDYLPHFASTHCSAYAKAASEELGLQEQ